MEKAAAARKDQAEAAPETVLAALGAVIRATSAPGANLQEVLESVIKSAVDLSRATFGNIIRLDETGDFWRVVAYAGDVPSAYLEIVSKFQYKPDRGSMIGRTLVEKRPVQMPDVLADAEYTAHEIQRAGGYRTLLGIPMMHGDEMVGLFVLSRDRVEPFTESQISLLSTFADQAVSIILSLRLRETIESQRREIARYAPQAAALLGTEGGEALLAGHRREISAMFADLRGFTAFAEAAEPEEVLGILREYHGAVGEAVIGHGGTVEHFAGDGLMAFFNDPELLPDHAKAAVEAAFAIRSRFEELSAGWSRRGYQLGLGIGIALGYATLGRVGFEGRFEYGALGNVVILASRLSDAAEAGEILLSQRLNAAVEAEFKTEQIEDLRLKGFSRPVPAFRVSRDIA
jgi:adenylate cyclase